jgi:uncharacterized protein (TIGR02391 family)
MSQLPSLSNAQIVQICKTIGDTGSGLTGSEIGGLLAELNLPDPGGTMTKWKRLGCALIQRVSATRSTNIVYSFISHCFEPTRGLEQPERYRWIMAEVNRTLMLVGVEIRDDGKFHLIKAATNLSEVERRTKELRNKLIGYGAHAEVLKCCRQELLTEDYYHAVHEAAKSLCDRVKSMTGLDLDGTKLFEKAFSSKNPYIALTSLQTESGRNQQNGLKELLNGVMHLVRNPTAHELRIHWDVNEKDAVDVLNLISYLHKLLDNCVVVPRPS